MSESNNTFNQDAKMRRAHRTYVSASDDLRLTMNDPLNTRNPHLTVEGLTVDAENRILYPAPDTNGDGWSLGKPGTAPLMDRANYFEHIYVETLHAINGVTFEAIETIADISNLTVFIQADITNLYVTADASINRLHVVTDLTVGSDISVVGDISYDGGRDLVTDIFDISGRVDANETAISANDTDIFDISGRVDANETAIGANDTDIFDISGRVDANETAIATLYTNSESETRYVNISGDVMTGPLNLGTNAFTAGSATITGNMITGDGTAAARHILNSANGVRAQTIYAEQPAQNYGMSIGLDASDDIFEIRTIFDTTTYDGDSQSSFGVQGVKTALSIASDTGKTIIFGALDVEGDLSANAIGCVDMVASSSVMTPLVNAPTVGNVFGPIQFSASSLPLSGDVTTPAFKFNQVGVDNNNEIRMECDSSGSVYSMYQEEVDGSDAWSGFAVGYDGTMGDFLIRSMKNENDPHGLDETAFGSDGVKTAMRIARDTGEIIITKRTTVGNELVVRSIGFYTQNSILNLSASNTLRGGGVIIGQYGVDDSGVETQAPNMKFYVRNGTTDTLAMEMTEPGLTAFYGDISANEDIKVGGSVGIGLSTPPLSAIHVKDGDIRLTDGGAGAKRPRIILEETAGSSNAIFEYNGVSTAAGNYVALYSGVSSWKGVGEGFNYIPSNGRIGLGTLTPTETLDVVGNVNISGTYKVGETPLLHISVPFSAAVANSTTTTDVHFFANYMTKYSVPGVGTVSGAFDSNKLRAYKHPTSWYIHSVSIMHDDDNSTNGITLYVATNLNSKGKGAPSYTTYDLGSKSSGDLCSVYTFPSPILVGSSNSIRARTKYSSSSANESSFVFHGYQA
jgi:hypothetical protein